MLVVLIAAALFASVLVACGDGRQARAPAATVNGSVITAADFQAELRVLADSKPLQTALSANKGPRIWTTEGAVTSDIASQWLASMIQEEIIEQDLAERGLTISPEQRASSAQTAGNQLGGPDVFGTFPKWFRDTVIERTAKAGTLLAAYAGLPPREADLRQYYADHEATRCSSGLRLAHILVATQAEAIAARAQIVSGTPFATVAQKVSTDSGSSAKGGDLGCRGVDTYVDAFENVANALAPNQLSQPVSTQFGWHLITVTPDSFDSARASIEEAYTTDAQDRFGTYLRDQLRAAHVTVDPRFGRVFQSQDTFEILPPQPPAVREEPAPGAPSVSTRTTAPGATGATTTTAPGSPPAR